MNINLKEQQILEMFLKKEYLQSSDVHKELVSLVGELSQVTVKRALSSMVEKKLLEVKGKGRATGYVITDYGRMQTRVDVDKYVSVEPDLRWGNKKYSFTIIENLSEDVFSKEDIQALASATTSYRKITKNISPTISRKEIERLVIELSWKSSKIEGNTYTLLDTEKLILENIEAPGHDKKESQMILNHKVAFEYIYSQSQIFKNLTTSNIMDVHNILVSKLEVKTGLREKPVGVLGSIYRPLDNKYQINEALSSLVNIINRTDSPYAKSLFALVGISYIQAFR